MPKSPKININDKFVGYFGFNDSSSSVIKLSVSRTDVQLPMLNTSFRNLLLLDASFNGLEKIDDIGNETFPSLRLFNLSFNALSDVKSYVFSHLKEMEILDLSHNCFVKFQYDFVFLKHEHLKKLYLNDNLLHSIQSTFGEPKSMTLDFLDFSNNFVSEFHNYDIKIHHLSMRNNSLKSVVIYDAENMILNAQHNQIVHFFAPRGTFIALNLSYNNLEYLSFVELEAATSLDLSHNNLRQWSPDTSSEGSFTFSSSEDFLDYTPFDKEATRLAIQQQVGVRVQFFNLGYNLICSVLELRHFKNCLTFNLESNEFKNVYPQQFKSIFPSLKRVNLINNPLSTNDEKRLDQFKNSSKGQLQFVYKQPAPIPPVSPLLSPLPLIIIPTLSPHLFNPTFPPVRDVALTTRSSPKVLSSPSPLFESTTQKELIKSTTEKHPTENVTAKPIIHESIPVWFYAAVFALIIFSVIVFLAYQFHCQEAVVPYRGFQEADNFL